MVKVAFLTKYMFFNLLPHVREGNIIGTHLHVMEQTKYKVGAP
jgi:hypothetical protein